MPDSSTDNLSRAALHTVAYADIFDYPLTAREIQHYLTAVGASLEEVLQALEEDHLFERTGEYFTLPGREEIVSIRMQREARSRELLPRAIRYGRVLGALPFVRMVALTGSLAMLNVSKNQDFDYMLVTAPGRVWTARAFALAFNRMTRLGGYTLCPNLILSEAALEWPAHDLYSARELCQMIPITGFDVYSHLMHANQWVFVFLPNCRYDFSLATTTTEVATTFQAVLELPLRGKLGDRLESWEMNRKIARFSKQEGFGTETVFNAEVCQGNFDHHRSWTYAALEKRLVEVGCTMSQISLGSSMAPAAVPSTVVRPGPGGGVTDYQSPRTATGA